MRDQVLHGGEFYIDKEGVGMVLFNKKAVTPEEDSLIEEVITVLSSDAQGLISKQKLSDLYSSLARFISFMKPDQNCIRTLGQDLAIRLQKAIQRNNMLRKYKLSQIDEKPIKGTFDSVPK